MHETQDWRHDAVCRDEDPELFFPIGDTGPALEQIDAAKAICHRCPVATQCLTWALESGQDVGVWGGMSEGERRASKRRTTGRSSLSHRHALRPGSQLRNGLIDDVHRIQAEDPQLNAPRIAEILGISIRTVERARAVIRHANRPMRQQ